MVYPPATDTGWLTQKIAQAIEKESVLNHIGQPDEVAEVVLFLASRQARYVTGNILRMH
jgi:3-oxoacyl-[acyl-carrier protein] reductase